MADWYVYQPGGAHLGPFSTETVAHAILAGRLPEGVHVGAPGGARWVAAMDVPVISRAVSGAPTPRQVATPEQAAELASTVVAEPMAAGGMRVWTPNTPDGDVDYMSTVMMVQDHEMELVPTVVPATPGAASMPPPRNSRTVRIDRAAFGIPLPSAVLAAAPTEPAEPTPTPDVDTVPEAPDTSPALFEHEAGELGATALSAGAPRPKRRIDMHDTCFFPDGVPSSVEVGAKK